ncbi:SDR family NAD(P)-dependent oxidoreductase [Massilia sp. PAMC28688]|uniref:SDR family NAD(P)-dependent oxidoreductase n=1 Tax=Massilia sp. PAMC28688 TaxID=2861283 RepID=UPI001C637E5C|nr:SDR family NAD(P)-dependent oxidoreductase [Massilia sp. PAMC28688]QYF93474.1 SDR family NAD(P)-dependent oxidoreductase [Massilia sp. PAMC28688]
MADFIKYIVSELKSKRLPKESARSLLEQFARGAGAGQSAWLHPLLHANTSDLSEQSFSCWFDGHEFFLEDHRVRLGGDGSSRVLPAVAYLEMARAAIGQALPAPAGSWLELRQVAWAEPVVVDARTKVSIALQAGEDDEVGFEVYSQADDGEERVHCQGRGKYVTGSAAGLDLASLEAQLGGGTLAGEALYSQLWQMGLEYGPAHRALDSLARGEGQALARLAVPDAAATQWQAYGLHPSLMDGALQACIGLMAPEDSGAQLLLPYAVEAVQVLQPCTRSMLAWVRHAPDSTAALRKLDIDLCDEQGRVCVRMRAFSARPVDASVPAGPVTAWASPQWSVQAVQAGPAPQQRHIWLCGMQQIDADRIGMAMNATGLRLPGDADDCATRYTQQATGCLDQLRTLLTSKLAGPALVQIVVEDDGEQALAAGLAGLLRTASQEHPQLIGQLVLVPPGLDTAGLSQLLQGEQGTEALVRHRAGLREVQRWQQHDWQGGAAPLAYRADGVYLITGGLGGLGRLFALDIVGRTAAAQVVLTGRAALDAVREQHIAALGASGRVHYRQLDLEDAQQAAAVVAEVSASLGRLDGIIHSAGQLADSFIINKDAAAMRAVLGPKVAGTVNLDLASRGLPLDFMILFSSLASALGNAGQADYASANGFMDQYAGYRNALAAQGQRQGLTVAINWPLWAAGGMQMDAATGAALRSLGMEALPEEVGIEALQRAVALGQAQVLLMQGAAEPVRRVLAGQPLAAPPARPPVQSAAVAAPGTLEEPTRQYLRRQLSDLLQIPLGRIDAQAALETYGMDSILAMKLTRELEKTFGALSKTLMFEYQTLAALARYFVDEHGATLATLFAQPDQAPVATVAAPPAASPRGRHRRGRLPQPHASAARIAHNERNEHNEPIAIIGMSGRYPQARDLDAFWRNLRDGLDCVTEVPPERWDWREHYSTDRSEQHRHYSKWGGFIEGVDEFDPLFFNISPREARYIDPQERLFLQHAWMAMEDAGYTRAGLQLAREGDLAGQVGVYAGVMYGEYQLFGAQAAAAGTTMPIANSYASIANRVSYALNLHGPSMTLDTMCSSSLTAIHLACQDLKLGRTDMAIAGGVNVTIHPQKYLMLSAGQFISSDGHCQSFGEGGDGYIPGEGVGIVVLKRLSEAERDGDTIHGVIRGSSLNHGGKTNGYTVPNPQAQGSAIARTLADANIDARHVSYVEAHGTGTKLGDPIEIAALTRAFGQHTQEKGFCRIGSAKSNIGHCESAAGIAGLMKVLLQMRHGEIAASLHADTLNPHIDFDKTPFVVNRSLMAWERPVVDGREIDRIAGLSSFGAGGSNAHMIVQEYRRPAHAAEQGGAQAIVLSARTGEQLVQRARDLLHHVEQEGDALDLAAVAYTLQVGREAMDERLAMVVDSAAQLRAQLAAFVQGRQEQGEMYRGQVRRNGEGLGQIGQDDDMAEAIDKWIARRKLGKLLELWSKGLDLDWSRLYSGTAPRRVSLPSYPFARERHWIDLSLLGERKATAVLHPLLHANTSDMLEQSYSSWFDGQEPFLAHHQVRIDGAGSRKVLPAVAYLEMAREAVRLAVPAVPGMCLELRQTVWAQPVLVDGPTKVSIALQAGAPGEIDFEIFSEGQDGDERVHCQGQAAYVEAGLHALDLPALQLRMQGDAVPADALYARLRAMGLEYGSAHQAVTSLARGQGELLARLQLPRELQGAASAYVLHPSMLDAALQACMGLLSEQDGAPLMLPYALASVRVVAACSERMLAWVRESAGSGAAMRKLDIDLCDESGQVSVELRGFSVRAVETGAPSLLWAVPAWETARPAAAPGVQQRQVWLLQMPQLDASVMEMGLPSTRCTHLHSAAGDAAGRYRELAMACFAQLQGLLHGGVHASTLVQVVVPDADGALLAGLSGLLRTASQENPHVLGQLVLVEPGMDAAALAQLLRSSGSEPLVRYQGGRREVRTWQEQPGRDAPWPVGFREDGIYLVTGGLGGLGQLFARDILASTARAQVVLTGRGAPDGRQSQLDELGGAGRAHYRQLDVEDAGAVAALIAAIGRELGPLAGILHSAGQVADSFILNKTAAQFDAVLGPKVAGTVNLDAASADLALDFMVLFSSLASALGNAGQADYASANGFMDQYAAHRNAMVARGERQGRTVAINWPLWEQGGMRLDPGSVALLRAGGMVPLQSRVGLLALHGALALGASQVLVVQGELVKLRSMLAAPAEPPVASALAAPAMSGAALEERTQDYLRRQLAAILQLSSGRIDVHAPLETYGIDSVMSMSLVRELEKTFGALSKTLLFEHQTLAGLARFFIGAHGARLATLFAQPVSLPAAPAPAARSPASGRRKSGRSNSQARVAAARTDEAVAIIGMSGRYPQARDLDAFWRNLRDGLDCVTEVPPERWNWREYFSADRTEPGRHYSKWGGFIEGVDQFDPLFFNISPREARYIDPQERLFLQHAWMAMEDAGYTRASLQLPREGDLAGQVGVYAGVMYSQYQLFGAQGQGTPVGGSTASIANRVSYALNLHGPSMTLDTMCSSSLTAIHLACQDLKLGRTDMAIAGGVNVTIHPHKYLTLSAGQFISSDGHCQSFGEGGDGYIPGEGVGVVILKRLSEAERDGDTIYGVIRGSGLNHGGKTNGYTVPNPLAQSSAIARTLADAGIDARHISYVEAHGTGTKLGDPIEIAALARAFGQHTQDTGFCRIGSAKSNIGHCESAAGIAGLMKVLLQMRHGEIAASLHADTLNPHIDFEQTPFVVNRSLTAWERPVVDGREIDRIAGLSSFGAGGSNAHVIVQEYRQRTPAVPASDAQTVFVLSARTAAQLRQKAQDLLDHVQAQGETLDLAAVAATLQLGREAMDERLGILAADAGQLCQRLAAFVAGRHEVEGLHTGQARRSRDGMGLISQDEDMKEAIDKWIARRKLGKLVELWTGGLDLDWSKLYAGALPRRVSLPAYPFAQERYWIETAPAAAGTGAALHPLVHANTSDLHEQGYASWFEGSEFFLADHQVRFGGQATRAVLPAVAYLEMARAATALALPRQQGAMELRQVVWARPLTVAGRTRIDIGLQAGEGGEVEFEVYSRDDAGHEHVHCHGRACHVAAMVPAALALAELELQMQGGVVEAEALYAQLAARGLEYGAGHRAVRALTLGSGQLLASLQLPAALEADSAAYVLHPSLVDAALQACMGLLSEQVDAPLMLPYAVETVCVYGPCIANMRAWVRESEGSLASLRKLDIDLCDEQGDVRVQLRGFSVRAVDSEVSGLLWAVPVWEAAAAPAPAAGPRHVWLLELPQVDVLALEALLPTSRCQHMHSKADGTAARFAALATACFEQIQALLQSRLAGPTLVQVVVPDAGGALLAGLAGLLRTASQENPLLLGQVVLVEAGIGADTLAALLANEGADVMVRYHGGRREVCAWQEQPWKGAAWPVALRDDGVYLVTGGLGGLGQLFAREILGRSAGAQVVLTGRGALDATRRKQLDQLGVRAHYRQLDLEDAGAVAALVDGIVRERGPLAGIIHSAGQVSDSLILKKTAAEFDRVLGPKVSGTVNLDAASAHLALDFMVLFSSLASALGNAGQADYATANGFMDQFAAHRNDLVARGERQGRTVAINWPLWEQGGMAVDDGSLSRLRTLGMQPLSTAAGLQALYGALAQGAAQVLLVQGEPAKLRRYLGQGPRSEPPAAAASLPAPQAAALEAPAQEFLRKALAGILQMPASRIDVRAPLETYGIDSVMSMDLVRVLEQTFGPLSKTLLFEYQSLEALARYFVLDHAATLGRLFHAGQAPAAAPAMAAPPEPAPAARTRRRFAAADPEVGPGRVEVAIVGVSGQYPQAADLAAYWENLSQGKDCITEIPAERWELDGFYDADRSQAGKSYAKWGGFISDVDCFDPLFFGISPMEAERIDPQERLFLQTTWKAIEDAGYSRQHLAGSRMGVFVGVMWAQYDLVGLDAAHRGGTGVAGSSHASIANRVSYVFDWHGPSMALDTMCSSSLTAIHLACESIRSGDSDAAIAGGVNVSIHPQKYLGLSEGKFLASDGRCRSFGAGGDGYVPGEGVGALVLKRLDHALRDGDHVYAVIRASGVNHGGKTNGYSVPNPSAQGQLIREVLARGAVAPSSVNYVEAHGTGTALGDPIEMKGLLAAFADAGCAPQSCPIGSVKSNIGHLEAAAGVAAVSKVLLQMQHGQLVPSLHAQVENPYIDFAASPFAVQKQLADWTPRDQHVRRACVSSFGAGGSNAHIVLDQVVQHSTPAPMAAPQLVIISARDAAGLRRYAAALARWVATPAAASLADVAYTMQVGRVALNTRLAIVANDFAELAERLAQWLALPEKTGGKQLPLPDGVVQGDARGLRDQVGDLLSGAGESFAAQLLAQRDLARLAQLWALGADIDWRQLPRHASPRRVALPTYPFARERYWVTPGSGAAIVQAKPAGGTQSDSLLFYRPQWTPEQVKAHELPAGPILLLGVSGGLADSLRHTGAALVHASWGDGFSEDGAGSFVLNPSSEAHFGQLLDALRTQGRLPAAVIHENACWSDHARPLGDARMQGGVYALMRLCKVWQVQRIASDLRMLSVSVSSAAAPAPYGSALGGFFRSLAAENPRFSGTTLELQVHSEDQQPAWTALAGALLAELHATPGAVRMTHNEKGTERLVRSLLPFTPAASEALPVRQGGVYLITGGLGGLGLVFASYLASQFKARLILSGRGEAGPAQQQAMAGLCAHGAQVRYIRADVSRAADVDSLVRQAREHFGAIDGVIHAAGVTRDAFVLKKNAQDMAQVLAPKIDGTIQLDLATREDALDWFVLFSSVAAQTGNPGQCDYAYGNHFMDSFAQLREVWRRQGQRSGQTLSINWPLWMEGGMRIDPATESLIAQETGLRALPTALGLQCFEALLASGVDQAMAVYGDAARIDAHVRRAASASPAPSTTGDGPGAGSLLGHTERFLQALVGEEIKLDPAHVDTGERFEAYGFDSVMVARVHARLEEHFGALPKTLLFERETIAELASYLVGAAGAAVTRMFGAQDAGPVPAVAAPVPKEARPVQTAAGELEPIAIIGIHGRYPGSPDLEAYWNNLKQGNDLVELVPAERWDYAAHYDADSQAAAAGKIYCKWGGFVDHADRFDPALFNMTLDEARSTDPQERLFLQSVWSALEDAGYSREALRARHPRGKGAAVGVYVGVTTNTYNLNLSGPAPEGVVTPSALPWSIANRTSYVFDFEGPSMPVDTACSSSLVAIHLACNSLRSGECEVAVAGGVNLYLHPSKYQSLCGRRMVSGDGVNRSYGAGGDGFVPGEGVGSVILKPVSRAIADGDRIYAVIRASASAHSGRSNGYSAPSPNAQASLIEHTLAQAGVDPASVGYVEGHGTGTPLGDGIEVAALTKAFRSDAVRPQSCPLGSVKANIGHAESAAGIAGLTKVLLQMQHGQLAPSLHADERNPNIEWDDSPFYLQRTLAGWHSEPARPRRALVNSFGAGGVNACLVLEQYLQPACPAADDGPVVFTLSARSTGTLSTYAGLFLDYLERHPQTDLAAICHTLQTGREAMQERLAVVASSHAELRARLLAWQRDGHADGVHHARAEKGRARAKQPPVAAHGAAASQLHALARAWVEGAAVQWAPLYGARPPLRVSLPTYPFEQQRCWFAAEGAAAAAPAPVPAPVPAIASSGLHPMVSHNASTLTQVSFSSLLPDTAFYAVDHAVDGAPVLPGAACMEIAVACGTLAAERPVVALRDIVWIRPLSFADGSQTLRTMLTPVSDGVEFAVTSMGADHERIVHAEGRLLLEGATTPAAAGSAPIALDELESACTVHYGGAQFYEQMARGGLVYGDSFHVIQEVHIGEGYALLRLALPAALLDGFGDYTLHPALLDGALHSVAALLVDQGGPFLPFALDGLDLVRPMTPECYVLVEYAEQPSSARQDIRKLNVQVCNARGELLISLEKLYLRQLNDSLTSAPLSMDVVEM